MKRVLMLMFALLLTACGSTPAPVVVQQPAFQPWYECLGNVMRIHTSPTVFVYRYNPGQCPIGIGQ